MRFTFHALYSGSWNHWGALSGEHHFCIGPHPEAWHCFFQFLEFLPFFNKNTSFPVVLGALLHLLSKERRGFGSRPMHRRSFLCGARAAARA